MKKQIATILCAGFSIFLINSSVLAENFMLAPDVKLALSGKTCSGEHLRKDFNFKVYFSPDGVVQQVKRNGDKQKGNWSVLDNGKRCLEWDGSDIRKCFPVRDNGDESYTLVKVKGNGDIRELILWRHCMQGNTLEEQS